MPQPSLLAIADLNPDQIRKILTVARAFSKIPPAQTLPLLSGLTVVNLFIEASTRTRISFEMAARRLGGGVVNFVSAASSLEKGETLLDTTRNLLAMRPSCFVIRHSGAGASMMLAKHVDVSIVNAGDGAHEHPTQALLDLYTLENVMGGVQGKKIVILGDIAHSRVARSNVYALSKMGARVVLCGPPTLLPPDFKTSGVAYSFSPEEVLPEADAVMALRVQLEREKQNHLQLPSLGEYRRFWGLTVERERLMKPSAVILHPGPVNRGIELDAEVADSSRSAILDQVASGVFVRMAVLASVCNPQGLEEWMKKGGHHG